MYLVSRTFRFSGSSFDFFSNTWLFTKAAFGILLVDECHIVQNKIKEGPHMLKIVHNNNNNSSWVFEISTVWNNFFLHLKSCTFDFSPNKTKGSGSTDPIVKADWDHWTSSEDTKNKKQIYSEIITAGRGLLTAALTHYPGMTSPYVGAHPLLQIMFGTWSHRDEKCQISNPMLLEGNIVRSNSQCPFVSDLFTGQIFIW